MLLIYSCRQPSKIFIVCKVLYNRHNANFVTTLHSNYILSGGSVNKGWFRNMLNYECLAGHFRQNTSFLYMLSKIGPFCVSRLVLWMMVLNQLWQLQLLTILRYSGGRSGKIVSNRLFLVNFVHESVVFWSKVSRIGYFLNILSQIGYFSKSCSQIGYFFQKLFSNRLFSNQKYLGYVIFCEVRSEIGYFLIRSNPNRLFFNQ